MYAQFSHLIQATNTSNPYSKFYEDLNGPLRRQNLSTRRPQQIFIPYSLQDILSTTARNPKLAGRTVVTQMNTSLPQIYY